MSDDNFNWGSLGETFWRTAGETVRMSEPNLKLLVGVHAGMKIADAARDAGVCSRQEGFRMVGTIRSRKVLALAAEKSGTRDLGIMSIQERRMALSALGRSRNPQVRLAAIASLNALDARQSNVG
jgi:hypothetical protein